MLISTQCIPLQVYTTGNVYTTTVYTTGNVYQQYSTIYSNVLFLLVWFWFIRSYYLRCFNHLQ